MDRIERLQAFLQRQPGDLFSRHALAMEYVKNGNDPAAREMLEGVLAMDPSYIGSYYHLGKLYERMGDIPAAIDIFERGIEAAGRVGDRHAKGELQSALSLID